jgi:hypothetical protein
MLRSESKYSHGSRVEDSDAKGTRRLRNEGKQNDLDDDGSALIKKVISFFFDDDAFAHTFERFAEENCAVFDPDSDEMKLE